MKTYILGVKIALWFAGCALISQVAVAEPINIYVNQKQEVKAKTRWSLAEWLETRDKMRLMDMWLVLHSPSPYEYYLGGNYDFASQRPGSTYSGGSVYGVAYASMFGLEVRRDWLGDASRFAGLFHFRFFGFHAQGTNMTLQLGVRKQQNAIATYQSALIGGTMTLYLAKVFGVQGLYRHYFNSTPNGSGQIFSGRRLEGTAFIDFSFLRFYGTYFNETESPLPARGGISAGAQIYF